MKDMHHNSSKRKTRARLAFVYTLMGLVIVAGVTILVLILQGYRFNRYDGKVEQGGLVQFDSKPAGATVTLDGTRLAAKTASKLTVSAGTHNVTIAKDGYLPWTKTVAVKAGSVLWLNYARPYPVTPKITSMYSYDLVTSALISPNRKQIVAVGPANQSFLYVTPLNDGNPETHKIAIQSDAITPANDTASASFSLVSWDQDNQYVIMKHVHDGATEYLSVDTNNGNAINITKTLGVTAERLEYVIGDHNAIYVMTSAHELRRGDVSAGTLSGPLLSGIADFAQADRSTVTYETQLASDGTRSVGYLTNGASRARKVQTVKDDGTPSLKFRMGTYYGDQYLIVAYGDTTTIYTAAVPSSDSSSTLNWTRVGWLTTTGGVSYLGFSPDTERFVYAQMQHTVATYDLETDVIAKVTLQGAASRAVDWMDNFHVGSTSGNAAYFYDFDGTNARAVASSVSDMSITISENDKYLYYFAPDGVKIVLKRVQLVN
ncbi:MAG: PEGA domain-containing protein [Candidatus Saccharimonas sp.]